MKKYLAELSVLAGSFEAFHKLDRYGFKFMFELMQAINLNAFTYPIYTGLAEEQESRHFSFPGSAPACL